MERLDSEDRIVQLLVKTIKSGLKPTNLIKYLTTFFRKNNIECRMKEFSKTEVRVQFCPLQRTSLEIDTLSKDIIRGLYKLHPCGLFAFHYEYIPEAPLIRTLPKAVCIQHPQKKLQVSTNIEQAIKCLLEQNVKTGIPCFIEKYVQDNEQFLYLYDRIKKMTTSSQASLIRLFRDLYVLHKYERFINIRSTACTCLLV